MSRASKNLLVFAAIMATVAAIMLFSLSQFKSQLKTQNPERSPDIVAKAQASDEFEAQFIQVQHFVPPRKWDMPVLKDMNDETVEPSAYRGKHVLVNFWVTWCIPCLEELPALEMLKKRMENEAFRVIYVSLDLESDAKSLESKMKQFNIPQIPTFYTPDQAVSNKIMQKGMPISYLLNHDGDIVTAYLGDADWKSDEAFGYMKKMTAKEIGKTE